MLDEFGIIKKYFRKEHHTRSDVIVGSGDDCAVLSSAPDQSLVMTIDTLLEGVHFLKSMDPADIVYKAIAVSLSDIAAMGAEPAWVLVSLSMEKPDPIWLERFAQGMFDTLKMYNIALVGGDLTRGPLSLTTQLSGFVPKGQALLRSGAKVGDKIFVTGTLGDSGLALTDQLGQVNLDSMTKAQVYPHLLRPTPRLAEGLALRSLATAAIDLSDGLVADLGHIAEQSEVGAQVFVHQLPLSPALKALDSDHALRLALSAGDDYELCFTLPAEHESTLRAKMPATTQLSCIGKIVANSGVELVQEDGSQYPLQSHGYLHF